MSHAQILSGASTNRLPANLGLAIDESIVRKIESLSIQIRGIEFGPDQDEIVQFLRQEISNLENQLADVRRQTI